MISSHPLRISKYKNESLLAGACQGPPMTLGYRIWPNPCQYGFAPRQVILVLGLSSWSSPCQVGSAQGQVPLEFGLSDQLNPCQVGSAPATFPFGTWARCLVEPMPSWVRPNRFLSRRGLTLAFSTRNKLFGSSESIFLAEFLVN